MGAVGSEPEGMSVYCVPGAPPPARPGIQPARGISKAIWGLDTAEVEEDVHFRVCVCVGIHRHIKV